MSFQELNDIFHCLLSRREPWMLAISKYKEVSKIFPSCNFTRDKDWSDKKAQRRLWCPLAIASNFLKFDSAAVTYLPFLKNIFPRLKPMLISPWRSPISYLIASASSKHSLALSRSPIQLEPVELKLLFPISDAILSPFWLNLLAAGYLPRLQRQKTFLARHSSYLLPIFLVIANFFSKYFLAL